MAELEQLRQAASRKVSIAAFHFQQLQSALCHAEPGSNAVPPIPVQAHFEGTILSVMAAVDQVAQAINDGLGLHLPPGQLVDEAFTRIGNDLPDCMAWYSDPLGRDLRRIRTKAMHYSYIKVPITVAGNALGWLVQTSGRDYAGSRELAAYARAALGYGEQLMALVPSILSRLTAVAS